MVLATCPVVDQSASIIRQNMAKIKLLTVAGPLLCHPEQTHRIVRLLANRHSWGIERPLVMLAVHSDDEKAAAERFQSGAARDLARYVIVRQKGHNETVGHAIDLFRQPVFGWRWNNLWRMDEAHGAECRRYHHQRLHEGVGRCGVLSGRMPILLS